MTVLSELTPELTEMNETDAVSGHRWMADHSFGRPSWTVEELIAAKAGRTISVVLPALNEEETVASVVETITPLLGGLVDELIVLDSGSTDDTEIRAVAAGARVVSREAGAARGADRSPVRVRCCGARWPRPPVTWWCSSTRT